MHGYAREYDTETDAIHLGYFKDGKPFVGRFEKFDMENVQPSNIIPSNVSPTLKRIATTLRKNMIRK